MNMTFSEKLVKLRKLKGITQDEFASAVGVSRQAVYKWESGQSYPEVPKLLEMKLVFGISIDDLLDENYEVILPEKKKRKRAPNKVSAPVQPTEAVKEEPALVTVSAPVAEAVAEEPAVAQVVEEPKAQAAAEEPAAAKTAEQTDIEGERLKKLYYDGLQKNEEEKKQPEKKKGFFQRLFGR